MTKSNTRYYCTCFYSHCRSNESIRTNAAKKTNLAASKSSSTGGSWARSTLPPPHSRGIYLPAGPPTLSASLDSTPSLWLGKIDKSAAYRFECSTGPTEPGHEFFIRRTSPSPDHDTRTLLLRSRHQVGFLCEGRLVRLFQTSTR